MRKEGTVNLTLTRYFESTRDRENNALPAPRVYENRWQNRLGGDSNKPNLSKSCKKQEMAESHDYQFLEGVWHTEEEEEE